MTQHPLDPIDDPVARRAGVDDTTQGPGWPEQRPAIPPDRLASWWSRAGALIIDALILAAIGFAVLLALSALGLFEFDADAGVFSTNAVAQNFVSLPLTFAYALLMLRGSGHRGQTWGKQAMGIRVLRDDGSPVTFGTVALREWLAKQVVFGILTIFTLGIATVLNYLWPIWDRENRALHDMIASTRVVQG